MSENDNRDPKQEQPQNPQQPFDYQAHYRQQTQQYYNPQQPPTGSQGYGSDQGGPNPQGYQNRQDYRNPYGYNPQNDPNWRPPVPPPVYTRYGTVDNTRIFSILSYIGILWLVGLLADRNKQRVSFHVKQGIILTIFSVILYVLISILRGFIGLIFSGLFSGVFFFSAFGALISSILSLIGWGLPLVFMIIGIVHAVQNREEPLPFIGTLFQVLK